MIDVWGVRVVGVIFLSCWQWQTDDMLMQKRLLFVFASFCVFVIDPLRRLGLLFLLLLFFWSFGAAIRDCPPDTV